MWLWKSVVEAGSASGAACKPEVIGMGDHLGDIPYRPRFSLSNVEEGDARNIEASGDRPQPPVLRDR